MVYWEREINPQGWELSVFNRESSLVWDQEKGLGEIKPQHHSTELSVLMEMFQKCTIQDGSHQSPVAVECMKRGRCIWEVNFYFSVILIKFHQPHVAGGYRLGQHRSGAPN